MELGRKISKILIRPKRKVKRVKVPLTIKETKHLSSLQRRRQLNKADKPKAR